MYCTLNKLTLLLICILSIIDLAVAQSSEGDWEKIKETDGFVVYTRSSDLSSVKEVKIDATFETNIDHFMKVLNDISAYPTWVYKCSHAHKLESMGENEFIYYVVSDIPFPLKDRDVIIHSKQWFDPAIQGYRTKSVALPGFVNEKPKRVRVPFLQSNWEIRAINENLVKIQYQILTEPGGSIPAWIVNLAITSGPIKTMKGLAKFLKK